MTRKQTEASLLASKALHKHGTEAHPFYCHLLNIHNIILLVALTPKSGRISFYSCVCAWLNLCAPCMYRCPQRSVECQILWNWSCVCWETKLDPLLPAGSALNPFSIFPSLHWLPFETLMLLQCYCGHSRDKRMEARSTYISGGKTNKKHPSLEFDGNGAHEKLYWWELCTPEPCSEMGAVHTWALHHSHLSARLRVMIRPTGW